MTERDLFVIVKEFQQVHCEENVEIQSLEEGC